MIKKIEHFWKGLSHDRTQISALPPEQYGDRFYNFVEGITMSAEEARREAQRRDREAVEAAEAPHRSSTQRHHGIPPMPDHQPPAEQGQPQQEPATPAPGRDAGQRGADGGLGGVDHDVPVPGGVSTVRLGPVRRARPEMRGDRISRLMGVEWRPRRRGGGTVCLFLSQHG